MTAYKKYLFLFISILIMNTFFSCNKRKENDILYKKPIPEKIDNTLDWLKVENNFLNKNYQTILYRYYDLKIKQKNYILAAKTLEVAAWNTANYATFDSRLFQTISTFLQQHKNEIPEENIFFINTYYGDYYTDKEDFKKAIEYYTKNTIIDVVDYQSCFFKADSYRTIAWCHHLLGNQDLALKNELQSLEYFKKTDNLSATAGIYSGIAVIYQDSKDYNKAEEFFNKALDIHYKNRNQKLGHIFITLYNKIVMYDKSINYEKKNPLLDSVYVAFKNSKLNDPSIKISINISFAQKLLDEDKIAEAQLILQDIKPDVLFLNSTITNHEYKVAVASLESKQNKGIRDTKIIHDAIKELTLSENFHRVRNLYAVLYNDAMNKKDYQQSMLYQDSMYQTSDSLGSREMANVVAQLDKKYQTKVKEQRIIVQEKTILNNNKTIALLISGLIGFIFITIALTLIRKQRIIKQEKQNIQLYTKQLLEKTEEERKRIASDLHDSVSHELLSLKNLLEQKSDTIDDKIDTIINDIRIISRNLHPIMFDKIGLKSSIEQLVERVQSVNNFMVTSDINYNSSLSTSNELQMYRIIQEALSNIIKHAKAIAAKITITEINSLLIIEIKDNGIGFNVAEKLSANSAFGLHNIIERSRAINGEVKISSDKNGTIIIIKIIK